MSYKFPSIYNFPPFFTKQPNAATFEAQLQQWEDVILGYCKANKVWILSDTGSKIISQSLSDDDDDNNNNEDYDDDYAADATTKREFNIFRNDEINRHASTELINDIIAHLVKSKHAEWVNPGNKKQGLLILWNTIEEWAYLLYDWIDTSGQNGTILTIYELQRGDISKSQEFSGMCTPTLIKVLETLVKQGKATLLKDEGKISGVKFL